MPTVGIVGVGYWGAKVARSYCDLLRVGKVGEILLVDRSEERVTFVAENLPCECSTLSDYRDLAKNGVDCVHLCTPSESHYPISRDIMRSGKGVLTEKPMSISSIDAIDMVKISFRLDIPLCVGHIFRFDEILIKAKDILPRVGEIHHIRLQWTTRVPPYANRDILWDLGPHPIDILNFLTDEWPYTVRCFETCHRREELGELAHLDITMPSGVTAHIELSWMLPGKTRSVKILGSDGCIHVDCAARRLSFSSEGSWENVEAEANDTILAETETFVRYVTKGLPAPNGALVGLRTVEVLEAAEKAARKECLVRPTYAEI